MTHPELDQIEAVLTDYHKLMLGYGTQDKAAHAEKTLTAFKVLRPKLEKGLQLVAIKELSDYADHGD